MQLILLIKTLKDTKTGSVSRLSEVDLENESILMKLMHSNFM